MTVLYRTRVARVIAAVAAKHADNLQTRWAVIMGIDHAMMIAEAVAQDCREAADQPGFIAAATIRKRLAEMRAKVNAA